MNITFKNIIKDICYLLAPFIAYLFLSQVASGQQQQTVFATIATNTTQGTNTFTTVPGQYMIGQSVHIFTVHEKDAPGHTCTSYYKAQIWGSYGDLLAGVPVRFPLQQVLVSAFDQQGGGGGVGVPYFATRVYQAQAAFPFVSINFPTVGSAVNCVYDIEYTGVLYTGSITNVTSNGFVFSSLQRVTLSGALAGAGATLTSAHTGFVVAIYGLKLCNNTAGTTYTIQTGAPNNTPLYIAYAMTVGQCTEIPLSNIPFITQVVGDAGLGTSILQSAPSTFTLTFLFRDE